MVYKKAKLFTDVYERSGIGSPKWRERAESNSMNATFFALRAEQRSGARPR
jgi:hypothetical protein